MRLAQRLYEGVEIGDSGETVGLITYMRTDSTRVSQRSVESVRELHRPRPTVTRTAPRTSRALQGRAKRAQEAHEAIRPTSMESHARDRSRPYLGRDEFRLYQLIWNRFVASQMESAVFDTTRADIDGRSADLPRHRIRAALTGLAGRLPRGQGRGRRRRTERREPENGEDRRLPEA